MQYPADKLTEIQSKLGIQFTKPNLLVTALTHSSFSKRFQPPLADNERLEFFGDAILKMVVSEYLFTHYPDDSEGDLTKIRARLVSDKNLSQISLSLGIGEYLWLSNSEIHTGGNSRRSNLANAFEAILGAIYLDQGYQVTHDFFIKILHTDEQQQIMHVPISDYKSHLQEILQQQKSPLPVYKIVEEHGPDHEKLFRIKVEVKMDGKNQDFEGKGHTKKEAQQHAAKEAIESLPEKA